MKKTISELIDSLITVNMKCWNSQERLMDTSLSDKERLEAAIMAQRLNARRTKLMMAIDEYFGEDPSHLRKTYE